MEEDDDADDVNSVDHVSDDPYTEEEEGDVEEDGTRSGVGSDVEVGDELDPEVEEEWKEVDQERKKNELPDVFYDWSTKQVHLGVDTTGDIIGSIRTLRQGEPSEQLCFYCRRHQCSVMVGSMKAPTHAAQLSWFARGTAIARGKEHKKAHMTMFGDGM